MEQWQRRKWNETRNQRESQERETKIEEQGDKMH
jgi:hypothetical protein